MQDFERCTPSEFHSIYKAWEEHVTALERGSWERMRMECLCMLQPHSRKALRVEDVMEFRWDKASEKDAETKHAAVSKEEFYARFARAKARFGLK